MRTRILIVLTTLLLAATTASAGTFNNTKCMLVHFAWGASDIHAVGPDITLYSSALLWFETDGSVEVLGYPTYPPGDYDKAGKNLTMAFYNPDTTPAALYEGRKRGKNKTCYIDDSKACFQGTMDSMQAPISGVWEGKFIGRSNCQ